MQGAELKVLESINWNKVTFDVLCIETNPSRRPAHFREDVVEYMLARGYVDYSGQKGRNTCKLRVVYTAQSILIAY